MRVRSMVFSLYGDYCWHPQDEVWLGAMIRLFREFGTSDLAVRSAASRMAREGWLRSRRSGRQSHYSLSARGWELIAEGRQRIWTRRTEPWDGRWCLFSYSLPRGTPARRERIRKELAWLGMGHLANGLWVSPNDRTGELLKLVHKYRVHPHGHVVYGQYIGSSSPGELVERCWDLRQVNEEYRRFMERWGPELERWRWTDGADTGLNDREAFVVRFQLTHEFRKFPFMDPDLPHELLPPGWAGTEALGLYQELYERLGPAAWRWYQEAQTGALEQVAVAG